MQEEISDYGKQMTNLSLYHLNIFSNICLFIRLFSFLNKENYF